LSNQKKKKKKFPPKIIVGDCSTMHTLCTVKHQIYCAITVRAFDDFANIKTI